MSRKSRRTKSPPFVQLFRWVTQTPAWRELDPPARALYLELKERYNGHNNGSIGLGCREAAKAINVGPDTASRAFKKLRALGFIEAATPSSFNTNGRRATEWLLTELPDNRTGHKPGKQFAHWKPEKTNPSPILRTLSPTSRTQIAVPPQNPPLRPTTRTETGKTVKLASDINDTSRSTISPLRRALVANALKRRTV